MSHVAFITTIFSLFLMVPQSLSIARTPLASTRDLIRMAEMKSAPAQSTPIAETSTPEATQSVIQKQITPPEKPKTIEVSITLPFPEHPAQGKEIWDGKMASDRQNGAAPTQPWNESIAYPYSAPDATSEDKNKQWEAINLLDPTMQSVWTTIENLRLNLRNNYPATQPILETPLTAEKSAEQQKRSIQIYLDSLKKLYKMISADKEKTTYLSQSEPLQQLFLHTVLTTIQTPNDTAQKTRQAAPHAYKDNADIVNAISKLCRELLGQWEDIFQVTATQSFNAQRNNIYTAYSNWTDIPLTREAQELLADFSTQINILSTKPDKIEFDRIGQLNKAATQLKADYKKIKELDILATSATARAAILAIPDQQDWAEGLSTQNKKALESVFSDISDDLNRIFLPKADRARRKQLLLDAQRDIDDTETAQTIAAKLVGTIAVVLYQNADKLFPVENFQKIKQLHPQFFAHAKATIPYLTEALKSFLQLVVHASDFNDAIIQSIANNEFPLATLLDLPDTFFTEAAKLPQGLRYPLAEQTLNLCMLLSTKLGGGSGEYEKLVEKFDGIALATENEKTTFDALSNAVINLFPICNKIDPTFAQDLPLELQNLAKNDAEEIPNDADLQALYTSHVKNLTMLLTTHKMLIVNNPRLRMIIFPSSTPSGILTRLPNNLSTINQTVSQEYFKIQQAVRAAINKQTGETIESEYHWNTSEAIVQNSLTPLHTLLTSDQSKSDNQWYNSSNIEKCLHSFQMLYNMLTLSGEKDKRNIIKGSAGLQDLIMNILQSCDVIFKEAAEKLSQKGRYELANIGAKVCKALSDEKTDVGLSETHRTTCTTFKNKFDDLALVTNEEKEIYTRFEAIKTRFIELTQKIETLITEQSDVGVLEDEKSKELQENLVTYADMMIKISEIIKDKKTRIMFGFNHRIRSFLFTESDDFFISDIPEGITGQAQKSLLEVLEQVLDNPKEFGYANTFNEESIKTTLRRLIDDAKEDERSAVQQLPTEAQQVYRLLYKGLLDLRKKETYATGAHTIYTLLNESSYQKLIKKHDPLYSLVFSPKGVLSLPEGVNLDNPAATLDVASLLYGATLYQLIKENPNDLGIKSHNDAITTSWIERASNSFTKTSQQSTQSVSTQEIQQAQAQTLQAQSVVAVSAGALTAQGVESAASGEEQTLLEYLQQCNSGLKTADRFEETARGAAARLDSKSGRETFGKYPSVVKLMTSPQGLLISSVELPKGLSLNAANAGIALYKTIKDNPNNLGYSESKAFVQSTAESLISTLTTQKNQLEQKDRDAQVASMSDSDINRYGAVVGVEEALGKKQSTAGWNKRQIELYDYLYKNFDDMRSMSAIAFANSLNIIKSMTTRIDAKDASFFGFSLTGRFELWRLMKSNSVLAEAFKRTVLVEFIPDEFVTSYEKIQNQTGSTTEKTIDDLRLNCLDFYNYIKENPRNYGITAEAEGRLDNLIRWFANPLTATRRSHLVKDELFDKAANSNNVWAQMAATQAALSGKSGGTNMAAASSGMYMMNPYGKGMIPGMNTMYGGMGMMTGMNTMYGMQGTMPGMMPGVANMGGMYGGGMGGMYGMPMMGTMPTTVNVAGSTKTNNDDDSISKKDLELALLKHEKDRRIEKKLDSLSEKMSTYGGQSVSGGASVALLDDAASIGASQRMLQPRSLENDINPYSDQNGNPTDHDVETKSSGKQNDPELERLDAEIAKYQQYLDNARTDIGKDPNNRYARETMVTAQEKLQKLKKQKARYSKKISVGLSMGEYADEGWEKTKELGKEGAVELVKLPYTVSKYAVKGTIAASTYVWKKLRKRFSSVEKEYGFEGLYESEDEDKNVKVLDALRKKKEELESQLGSLKVGTPEWINAYYDVKEIDLEYRNMSGTQNEIIVQERQLKVLNSRKRNKKDISAVEKKVDSIIEKREYELETGLKKIAQQRKAMLAIPENFARKIFQAKTIEQLDQLAAELEKNTAFESGNGAFIQHKDTLDGIINERRYEIGNNDDDESEDDNTRSVALVDSVSSSASQDSSFSRSSYRSQGSSRSGIDDRTVVSGSSASIPSSTSSVRGVSKPAVLRPPEDPLYWHKGLNKWMTPRAQYHLDKLDRQKNYQSHNSILFTLKDRSSDEAKRIWIQQYNGYFRPIEQTVAIATNHKLLHSDGPIKTSTEIVPYEDKKELEVYFYDDQTKQYMTPQKQASADIQKNKLTLAKRYENTNDSSFFSNKPDTSLNAKKMWLEQYFNEWRKHNKKMIPTSVARTPPLHHQ